ncbi:hypothetical protein B296_00036705 [Ensete ventricosum]|uniref:UBC core domain-containing protein n=1 Tax=Ensete ventricosum TaxID=4639 RepID=A0A426Y9T1_ENSVE|nr:hypothetical protein B296_00036705 [Ensete ventricosum]
MLDRDRERAWKSHFLCRMPQATSAALAATSPSPTPPALLVDRDRRGRSIRTKFLVQSLLCDPNPNSPANSEAARMFSENKREYNRKVRDIVEQSWTAD